MEEFVILISLWSDLAAGRQKVAPMNAHKDHAYQQRDHMDIIVGDTASL